MGAATSLIYCGTTKNVHEKVAGMILDSPFSSLKEIVHDLAGKYPIPSIARL